MLENNGHTELNQVQTPVSTPPEKHKKPGWFWGAVIADSLLVLSIALFPLILPFAYFSAGLSKNLSAGASLFIFETIKLVVPIIWFGFGNPFINLVYFFLFGSFLGGVRDLKPLARGQMSQINKTWLVLSVLWLVVGCFSVVSDIKSLQKSATEQARVQKVDHPTSISDCDSGFNHDQKMTCVNTLARNTNNPSFCAEIVESDPTYQRNERALCYEGIARNLKDYTICNLIEDPETPPDSSVAYNVQTKASCFADECDAMSEADNKPVGEQTTRVAQCYLNVVNNHGDKRLCDQIENQKINQQCLSHFK